MNDRAKVLSGMAAGAAVMYVLDPDAGRGHRARLADQIDHGRHQAGDFLGVARTDLRNHLQGLSARYRARGQAEPVSDDVLTERVRARLGRFVSHPHAVEVSAHQGVVRLRGPILRREALRLLPALARMAGVQSVDNQLELHHEATGIAALQGGERRAELMRRHWSPALRVAGALGGGLTLLTGNRLHGLPRIGLNALGAGLLIRSAADMPFTMLAGRGGRRVVDVHKTINVQAPIDEAFQLWTDFTGYPRFMSHVRQVERSGDRLRWVVDGPGGLAVEWDAIITELIPNVLVAWKSVPGASVRQVGVTRFDANPDGSTRVSVRMSYNPPFGAAGHVLASVFHADPKHAFDDDLVRFKSLLEEGRTTVHGETVTRDDLGQAASSEVEGHQASSS